MPSETFDATAGAFATLEATAQAENPDDAHRLVTSFKYPDAYGICSCGSRIDAAHVDQVEQLHRDHAEAERKSKVFRPAARRGLAASRERLRETVVRKGSA